VEKEKFEENIFDKENCKDVFLKRIWKIIVLDKNIRKYII
jgi:hypothetical protein